ncbi:hypothetical protein Taro_021075 [Colocasia esculenta]|uniref:Uncharacterized protein n=1 Tax=Colocasia esculenta TaxID=4460 RepID=A0A843V757_COLES|nr:hypothetical protein [Colocasia esculenta]
MWMLRVAVAVGGIGVDANLRILQVIGSPESRFPTCLSLPLAPASHPRVSRASNSMCGALAPVALFECVVHVLDMWFTWKTCVGYPRFFVSQERVFVVLGVLSRYLCCTVEVCVVFLDTLTPEFELYVRLRERRQWGSDFPEFVL